MQIKLYTIVGCRNCLLVKSFFAKMKIEYTEVDCDKNLEEARQVMTLAGSDELPIIRYNEDNFIIGYDEENLMKRAQLL